MLTSITPLGERGRGNRYWHTRTWLMTGHVLGGAALGVAGAVVGAGMDAVVGRPSDVTALWLLVAATAAAVVADLGGVTPPGRRQVDERWLTTYRGWVYGLGFGSQLGFGLVTVVNTMLLAVVVIGAVLLPPGEALLLGASYGATRGVLATVNGRVRSVNDLRRLHERLDRNERAVRWTLLAGVAAVALGSAIAA